MNADTLMVGREYIFDEDVVEIVEITSQLVRFTDGSGIVFEEKIADFCDLLEEIE